MRLKYEVSTELVLLTRARRRLIRELALRQVCIESNPTSIWSWEASIPLLRSSFYTVGQLRTTAPMSIPSRGQSALMIR